MWLRTMLDTRLSRPFNRQTLKVVFLVLLALTGALLVLQSQLSYTNWLCQDWVHDRIRYSIWPIDYTPRGNATAMRILYKEYLKIVETPTYECKKRVRYGNMADGGWDICDEPQYAIKPPCLVHSWGINWDFSFDDSMGEKAGCHVYSFDPSMGTKSFERSEHVHFYNFGIKGTSINEESEWDLRTYVDTLQYLGQQRKPIDFVKMDVEGAEWSPLGSPTVVDDILRQVRQLALELHIFYDITESQLRQNVQTLKRLRQAGFEIYETERNPCGLRLLHRNEILGHPETCCHNVYFVNTQYRPP